MTETFEEFVPRGMLEWATGGDVWVECWADANNHDNVRIIRKVNAVYSSARQLSVASQLGEDSIRIPVERVARTYRRTVSDA